MKIILAIENDYNFNDNYSLFLFDKLNT